MKKKLVHAHIFYPELWEELKERILNISSHQYDLYVTLVENNNALIQDILLFKPTATILIIKNLGFDVGAFLHVLGLVDLQDYSYVIKLHSKRDMLEGARLFNRYNVSGKLWRNYLLSFLDTPQNYNKCIEAFETDNHLGMCGHYCLITRPKITSKDDQFAFQKALPWLEKMGLPVDAKKTYVHGTMFIARANIFVPLQKLNLTLDTFDKPNRQNVRSLAHVFERVLGCIVTAQGYQIKDCFTSEEEIQAIEKRSSLERIVHFFYDVRVSRSGKRRIRICKLPLWVTKNHEDSNL